MLGADLLQADVVLRRPRQPDQQRTRAVAHPSLRGPAAARLGLSHRRRSLQLASSLSCAPEHSNRLDQQTIGLELNAKSGFPLHPKDGAAPGYQPHQAGL